MRTGIQISIIIPMSKPAFGADVDSDGPDLLPTTNFFIGAQ